MAEAAVPAAAAAGSLLSAKHTTICVLDFGSQYSHLVVRRIRELGVYCELHSCLVDAAVLEAMPLLKGVIFSGGPFSVYEEGAPHVHASVWAFLKRTRVPVLGVCYGLQEMTHALGGTVERAEKREFGHALVARTGASLPEGMADILEGMPAEFKVWMSHGDKLVKLAPGFTIIGSSDNCEGAMVAGFVEGIPMYGVQFHPEVTHTPEGKTLLANFCLHIAGAAPTWSMAAFLAEAEESIRRQVGPEAHVIGAVSGGVDSTVAAVLLNRALGSRFHAVLVDNGVLRLNEREQVLAMLRDKCGVDLRAVDASELFLSKLKGLTEPEAKRKVIGHTFIEVFEAEAKAIAARVEGPVEFLLQGTLYPDVIESVSFRGPSATIKSHHNVGGLLADMKLKLVEPLRELFKDEVRALGLQMGLPRDVVMRHPFPGPGLAIRVLGEVTRERCDVLRAADAVYLEELRRAGAYDSIGQAFVVLLPVKTVGVMGDCRTYEDVACLRAVTTTDFMTADFYRMDYDLLARISTRIINEVRGINRVTYDVSSKPPSTIEWE